MTRIPTNLVTGATGAGKSTAIARLLDHHPAGQHWAVLVNDFGASDTHLAQSTTEEHVTFREVAGCVCCTGQVALRTALVKMLRGFAPQRLLIEASAAAQPAALLRLLQEPGVANALELRSTLCVVDTKQFGDSLYLQNDVYREQITSADAIYISKTDAMTLTERIGADAALKALRSGSVVVFEPSEPFDIDLLDAASSG
ncbi:MAG: GTP-binding protein [Burkholderiales bacterium]